MKIYLVLVLFLSILAFSACPSTTDFYDEEDSYLEQNVYQEESFDENSDIEEEYHHMENQADIAGDMIF